jgi:hypothetical protein
VRSELADQIRAITDVFTGADGGVAFVQFRNLAEEMDRQAVAGDRAADEVLQVIRRFARLLEAARVSLGQHD